jgi:serine/threonine-protein kinase
MAPEQIRGQTVDARTDVYALGVLIHQLATGVLPFVADSAVEVEEQHLTATPPRVSALVDVPEGVDEVVRRCMAKSMADRYGSASEVITALRAAMRGESSTEGAAGLAVTAEIIPTDDSDASLDVADDLMVAVEQRLETAGMSIAVRTQHGVIAVARLPRLPEATEAQRERLMAACRAAIAGCRRAGGPVLTMNLETCAVGAAWAKRAIDIGRNHS